MKAMAFVRSIGLGKANASTCDRTWHESRLDRKEMSAYFEGQPPSFGRCHLDPT